MKKIRCPKCDEAIAFDETKYESGRTLVFECPSCHKQFRIRLRAPQEQTEEAANTPQPLAYLSVIENAFHLAQVIPLFEGENAIGRHVRGTKANAAIKTVDPSVDTTHCHINIQRNNRTNDLKIVLRDGPSNTGTFLMNELVPDGARINIEPGAIITIGATTMILKSPKDLEEQ